MSYHIDIQHACDEPLPVADETLTQWAVLPLKPHKDSAELTLRFVDSEEMTHLNHTYRHKNKATNVLAFPVNLPQTIELEYPLLGDVIICPAVLKEESLIQNKPLTAHCAHIVIHGVLHLLGYDHINEEDTNIMQALEIELLAKLGFENPYKTEGNEIE
ncbi:rRNA maturation RNase YbeY [Legionella nagasakiensis]|uniref:rRNA maturation RNase YbeY n=1 Tax=Legionella nagasakiensis TaxID=535290 RepID=UPI001054E99E|nr:rRNA maturation RNase YbeY [Legionella nagasakiensis]